MPGPTVSKTQIHIGESKCYAAPSESIPDLVPIADSNSMKVTRLFVGKLLWGARFLMRKSHRWGALIVAAPFLIVLITGLILQLKKEWHFVQPPTKKGTPLALDVSFATILSSSQTVPEANIQTWEDIERLDVRPDKGIIKVQAKNYYEIQLDSSDGKVLQVAYRNSDWLEAMHDGSWFHEQAKLWIFLPSAVIVLTLWISGIYLFFLPWSVKLGKKTKKATET